MSENLGTHVESREALIEIVGRAIAADQGEAYAEHLSEYRQYGSIAVDTLITRRDVCGFSVGGVNVFGSRDNIKAVIDWHHSHSTIDQIRTQLRHWREECGKLHAQIAIAKGVSNEMLEALYKAEELLEPAFSAGLLGDDAFGQITSAIAKAEGRE